VFGFGIWDLREVEILYYTRGIAGGLKGEGEEIRKEDRKEGG